MGQAKHRRRFFEGLVLGLVAHLLATVVRYLIDRVAEIAGHVFALIIIRLVDKFLG